VQSLHKSIARVRQRGSLKIHRCIGKKEHAVLSMQHVRTAMLATWHSAFHHNILRCRHPDPLGIGCACHEEDSMIADPRDETGRQPLIAEAVFWGVWAAWTAALLLTYFYR